MESNSAVDLSDCEEWSWGSSKKPAWMLTSGSEHSTQPEEQPDMPRTRGFTPRVDNLSEKSYDHLEVGADKMKGESNELEGAEELNSTGSESGSDNEATIANRERSISFLNDLLTQAGKDDGKDNLWHGEDWEIYNQRARSSIGKGGEIEGLGCDQHESSGNKSSKTGCSDVGERNMETGSRDSDQEGSWLGVKRIKTMFNGELLGRRVNRRGRKGVILLQPVVNLTDTLRPYVQWEDDDSVERVKSIDEILPYLCNDFDPHVANHKERSCIASKKMQASRAPKNRKKKKRKQRFRKRLLPKKNPHDESQYMEGKNGCWYPKKVCYTAGDVCVEDYFFMKFDESQEWEVERIADEKIVRKRKKFLVKFKGFELNPGTRRESGDWLDYTEANELTVMDAWVSKRNKEQ